MKLSILALFIGLLVICCKKESKTCGKITDVSLHDSQRKDTIYVRFKVQFSQSDTRSFSALRNEKSHPDQFWYDLIGDEYCLGDHLPD